MALALGLFVLGFYAGTVIQISKEQAEIIKSELREKNQNLNALGIFVIIVNAAARETADAIAKIMAADTMVFVFCIM